MNRGKTSIKEKLLKGTPVFGVAISSMSPSVTEWACQNGYDFILLDREFATEGWDAYKRLINIAKLHDTGTIIRVEKVDEYLIEMAITIGAEAVFPCHVTTKKDAELSVNAAKRAAKRRHEDSNVLVGVLIEEKEGMENLEKIFSVKGLDFAIFGPHCYGLSLGLPFKTVEGKKWAHHPRAKPVRDAFKKFLSTAKLKGIFVLVWGLEHLNLIKSGEAKMIAITSDSVLKDTLKEISNKYINRREI